MGSIKRVENEMSTENASVSVRTYQKEDIGYIIQRHQEVYADEYGFGEEFGEYVRKYILEFEECHDSQYENIWIAEVNQKPAGVIAIVKTGDSTAQLRWFLVEPDVRGQGLGHILLETALGFCREKRYKHVYLWTVSILEAARHLYENYGFKLTETKINETWGGHLIEERWDLYSD